MAVRVEVTPRALKYGYLFWSHKLDREMKDLLGNRSVIDVWFNKSFLGKKNIDWRYRRISLGWKQTRMIDKRSSFFVLELKDGKSLNIIC